MHQEKQTFIGIGSNLGDRVENCTRSLELIDAAPGCRVICRSGWYETEPVGMKSSNWFVNAVAEIMTCSSPSVFMELLLQIEKELGRERSSGCLDRTVDLDLLYYQGVTMGYEDFAFAGPGSNLDVPDKNKGLVVPHPAVPLRRCVLAPWAEIASDLRLEPWGRSVAELLAALRAHGPAVRCLQGGVPCCSSGT